MTTNEIVKNCDVCNTPFTAKSVRWRFCNPKCKLKHKNSHRTQYPHTCEYCGKEWVSTDRIGRFCSNACIAKATKKAWSTAACRHCNKEYLKQEAYSKVYCSEECKKAYLTRTCKGCGETFTGDRDYCGAKCFRHLPENKSGYEKVKARSRYRQALKQELLFLLLAERHGNKCNVCGLEIDMHATGSAGPSHDHVQPLIEGGSNTPDNVRLAHRGCNSRKGKKRIGE